jgi:hypothetical protein
VPPLIKDIAVAANLGCVENKMMVLKQTIMRLCKLMQGNALRTHRE